MANTSTAEAQDEQDPKVKIERFNRSLRIALTIDEVAERADRAAHVLGQRDQKEHHRKAANTAAKSQIEELEAELRRISSEVRDKATYGVVECERRFNYRLGRVIEVRLDTDEPVHERAMTLAERQLELDVDQSRSGDEPDEDEESLDGVDGVITDEQAKVLAEKAGRAGAPKLATEKKKRAPRASKSAEAPES